MKMRKADKAIDRAKAIIQKAIDGINEERREAEGNYNDTGYQRYYNKMQACEDDIARLEGFIHSVRELALAEHEVARYRKMYSMYLDRLDNLYTDWYNGNSEAYEIIGRCKSILKVTEMEA